MSEDLITSDNVSKELIKSCFYAAYIDVIIDKDGDIEMKDDKVFLRLAEKKDRIRIFCFFSFKEDSQPLARLQCANSINEEYLMVRAIVSEKQLIFNYDLMLGGGITKKMLVMTAKRFASIPDSAVQDHGKGMVK